MKSCVSVSFLVAFVLVVAAGFTTMTSAADHREAPLIREDPSADIADVYAFLNPSDSTRLVLVMTVNPFSVRSENLTYAFSEDVRYSFKIDTTGNARANHRVEVRFSDPTPGTQSYNVYVDGANWISNGAVTLPSVEPMPNAPVISTGTNGIVGFAGQRDDPFFFDSVGFVRLFSQTGTFTGTDGFAGYNVSAIVLELPVASFLSGSNTTLQIWGVTERRFVTLRRSSQGKLAKHIGPWQQVDRAGNPAVNGLLPPTSKDFFNIGRPKNDVSDFEAIILGSLTAFGTDATNQAILKAIVVPDTLKLDTSAPIAYPNGRGLTDDVIDTVVFYVFNQNPVPDGVTANDKPFLSTFPYLAAPHQP